MSTEHEPNDVEVVDKNESTDNSTISATNEENVNSVGAEEIDTNSTEETSVEAAASGNSGDSTEEASQQSAADDTVDVQALHDELAAVQKSINDYKDQVLRAQAEQQNIRRRLERDVSNAHKYAVEKLAKDLLPIIDSLEHATQAMNKDENKDEEAYKAVGEGVELSLKMFTDTLTKHSIVAVDPEGEPFDPQFHEAMSMIVNEDVEPNTVIAVMQKGYTLNQRLIRPARVIVAKAKD